MNYGGYANYFSLISNSTSGDYFSLSLLYLALLINTAIMHNNNPPAILQTIIIINFIYFPLSYLETVFRLISKSSPIIISINLSCTISLSSSSSSSLSF